MSKTYLTIFSLSWQNEFTYRFNFILWRFRNVLRFLLSFLSGSKILELVIEGVSKRGRVRIANFPLIKDV